MSYRGSEKEKQAARKYRLKNKEKVHQWKKEWNKNNPDKIHQYEEKRKNSGKRKEYREKRDAEYRNKPENKLRIKLYGKEYGKKNRKKRLMQNKKYKQSEKGKNARHRDLIKTYGLTVEQYDQMLELQNGVCAICGGQNKDGRRLFIDHCHQSKKIRGLLCTKCNLMLGAVNDSVEVLANAIKYLTEQQ